MSRGLKTIAISILLLSPPGCRDTTGPCDRPFACEVDGADLYIPQLEIIASAQDSVDGLGIIDPGPVDIAFTVRNRGDSISAATSLILRLGHLPTTVDRDTLFRVVPDDTLAVPALRPGEEFQKRITIDTHLATNTVMPTRYGDVFLASARIPPQDADTTNNRQLSLRVHVRVAVLSLSLEVTDTAIHVNVPFPAVFTIVNSSLHGTMPASRFGFYLCRYDPPVSCDEPGGPMGFGLQDIPPVNPSSTYQWVLNLTVPPGASYDYDYHQYEIESVIVAPGTSDTLLFQAAKWFQEPPGPIVSIHPDYRVCNPPLLVADSTVTAILVCTNPFPHYVFRFDANANEEYSIEQTDHPGASLYDNDGAWVNNVGLPWFHVQADGTYWIVDFLPGADPGSLRTMTLRERIAPATVQ